MKNVPLVVWNHGGGEYAGQLENTLVANRGLTAWVEAGYNTAVLQIQFLIQTIATGQLLMKIRNLDRSK